MDSHWDTAAAPAQLTGGFKGLATLKKALPPVGSIVDQDDLQEGKVGFRNEYQAGYERTVAAKTGAYNRSEMKQDSWGTPKYRPWKKKLPEPLSAPDRSLLSDFDANVNHSNVRRYKRSHYTDRKFFKKPVFDDVLAKDDVFSNFGSKVSLRGPQDTVSMNTMAAARLPPIQHRHVCNVGHGRYQGPLSQWQVMADMYIDSDVRKRGRLLTRQTDFQRPEPPGYDITDHQYQGRRKLVGRRNETQFDMVHVEKPPAQPCERKLAVDKEIGLPRKRMVFEGPVYSTTYAHWHSRIFSPPKTNGSE
ncbi:uncharacterized protein LOC135401032 [Ornithodoros turicata]|uniref:uncharacterized protein LOC135401032 n=1 Tax=Ornithodoros turicata TaxID=34597 RepID=UPI00313A3E7C